MNIKLDANGDWDVTANKLSFVTGIDEIAQMIAVRLRTIRGEWFLDTTRGFPWFSTVFKKRAVASEIENRLQLYIAETPGVITIEKFDLEYIASERKLSLALRAKTTDGVLDFTVEAP